MTAIDRLEAFGLSPQQRRQWRAGLPPARLVLEVQGDVPLARLQERLTALAACHEALHLQVRPEPGLQVPLQVVSPSAAGAIALQVSALDGGRHAVTLELPGLAADHGTLLRLVSGLASAQPPQSDDDAMTYTQYSAWLQELQGDEDGAQGRAYWAGQALEEAAHSELLYRQVRNDQASTADTTTVELDAPVRAALEGLCQRHAASAESVLMAAWSSLLQRLGSGDASAVTLDWLHDCRDDYEELEDCWGLFAKALPLSLHYRERQTFGELLADLQALCEHAVEWQEYASGDMGRFGFQWRPAVAPSLNLLGAADTPFSVQSMQTPAGGIELLLVANTQRLSLIAAPDRYSPLAVQTLLEQLQSLLVDAWQRTDVPLASLSLQSPSFTERLATLHNANCAQPFVSVPTLFERCAMAHAERIALRDPRQALSYAQVQRLSGQLGAYLLAQGLGPEDRVALYLDRSAEMVLAMLAVLRCGATFVPLDVQQPAQRTLAMLQQAQPKLVISGSAGRAPALPATLTLDLADEALWQQGDGTLDARPVQPDDAAYVLFTSGSTGTPKGVIVEHGQLASYVASVTRRLQLAPGEHSAVVTALAADLGYTLLFPALVSGGELQVLDKDTVMDPQAWADWQRVHGVDHLKVVPSLLDAWLGQAQSAAVLPRKQLILGGEPCSPRLLQRLRELAPALTLCNHYGPTETTVGVAMHRVDAACEYRRLPLSERLDGMRLYLLDEHQQPAAPGLNAELYIGGSQVARGYLDAGQDAGRFIELAGERLYRSGDMARYLPDGSLEITGRADRQVKIRGYRVELDEIQAQLAGLPGVSQAAVECVTRGERDTQLFAFLTLAPGSSASVAQLHGQAQDRLPEHMLPTLRIVETLPLMGNGKLDRKTLQGWIDTVLDTVGDALPRTPLEALLAQVWAQVLGLERVGIDDDFFALGGHSLAAVTLASRLQGALSAPVTVNAVFAAPSVAAFAALVQAQLQLSPLVRLSSATAVAPEAPQVFCFHPSTGHVQDYRPLAKALPDWHLWGLQAPWLSGHDSTAEHTDIASLARLYLQHVRRQQAHGPYHLLGFSLGGLLAIEVAAQLEREGEEVAFLGILDSQYQREAEQDCVDTLLASAAEALTADSQSVLRQLPPAALADLSGTLEALPGHERLLHLVQWARQQGLQLDGDSWEHLHTRLGYQQHTRQLLASFRPPQLAGPVHLWWADDTLQADDFVDPHWERLSRGPLTRTVIAAQHLTLLEQPALHQQLAAQLERSTVEGAA